MQHPDEGTIHAWLDGALPPEEGRAIEEHAAGCAACAAAIAEARGLIAGSSRILAALDAVPGGVLPAAYAVDALGSERAMPARRQRWRSVPLRAAAAIVLVGSVSWLATRAHVQRDATPTSAVAMAPAEERAAALDTTVAPPSTAPAMDKSAPSRPSMAEAAPTARRFEVPRPKPAPTSAPSRREADNVVAQAAAPVTAAPTAQLPPAPMTARIAAGSAGAATALGRRDIDAAKVAMLDSDSVSTLRAANEQRLVASSSAKMQAPMAMSAPMNAPLMPGSVALRRLAGCYSLDLQPQSAADGVARGAASLLPARVELREERADSSDPAAMIARSAPTEPALSEAARARWKTLGEHAVELKIVDGARVVTATLAIAGDSVSGWVRASTSGKEGTVSPVRGHRVECAAPSER